MTMRAELGAWSTGAEVLAGIDIAGRRVLVTGISSGLGLETTRLLAAAGASVTGTVRDMAKARDALAGSGCEAITLAECDLASLASVRACADGLARSDSRFDVVIANAGVMNCPFGLTGDGFETHWGTNHLGHFVLVNRVEPLIPDGGRVVVLTSRAHQAADVDIDDPGFANSVYEPFVAYGRSKSANILFAVEFDRRWRGRGVRCSAVQPGGIRTSLLRHTTPEMMAQMVAHSSRRTLGEEDAPPPTKSVAQGIATTLWAAFAAPGPLVGGRYCEDCQVADISTEGRDGVRPYALDPERAEALWRLSERQVGERFPPPARSEAWHRAGGKGASHDG